MLGIYRNLKEIYKEYVIFMINGKFIEVYNRDAIVINRLMGYKLMLHEKHIKLGFRVDYKNKVFSELEKNSVNYIIWHLNTIDVIKHKINRYNEFYEEFLKLTS